MCVCVCVCVCVHACQLPCSLCRVKVVGDAQEKEAMEEEGPVKDAITVAAEQEEAVKENGLTQTGKPVEEA